jgi:hypothetical protein
VILLDVMQRGTNINSDAYISTLKKMKHLQCVGLCNMLLKRDNTGPHTSVKTGEAITIWMDTVTASTLQAQLSSYIVSLLQTPEGCRPQKEV